MDAIKALYPVVFPAEDLLPLVRDLLAEKTGVTSLVASNGGSVIGHFIFTSCSIETSTCMLSLLGPLAVLPSWQGRGVGGSLIRDGLRRMTEAGFVRVFVLGDPAFYGRFGFREDSTVTPPFPLPEEWRTAWQSISVNHVGSGIAGVLNVPTPWRQPALWGS